MAWVQASGVLQQRLWRNKGALNPTMFFATKKKTSFWAIENEMRPEQNENGSFMLLSEIFFSKIIAVNLAIFLLDESSSKNKNVTKQIYFLLLSFYKKDWPNQSRH